MRIPRHRATAAVRRATQRAVIVSHLCMQALLVLTLDGRHARIGVPLPAAAVARGLRLEGHGHLQWRRLPVGGATSDPVWVELALCGSGTVQLVAGGATPCPDGRGPVFVREVEERTLPHGKEEHHRWLWCDGVVDEIVRTVFTVDTVVDGETFAAGEALTVSSGGAAERSALLCRLPGRVFEAAGVLPPRGRLGDDLRRQLAATLPALRELPGRRGAGDFARSGGVITNGEFDTTLAVLRCALSFRDEALLQLAARCAVQVRDRDLDARTGLPFPHGMEHRSGLPEGGHAWLQGLLGVGLLTADDSHLATARSMAHALSATMPRGEGRGERARDFAWPLLALETLLAVDADQQAAKAADRLAISIDGRFDPAVRTFRFGEGEVGPGIHLERAWITGGIVLPALQAHLARRPQAALSSHVRAVQQGLLDQIAAARGGLPTHWRCAGGRTFQPHLARGDPAAVLMFEGLAPPDLQRLLRREHVRDYIAEVLSPDDPDIATALTMVARCTWVWR